MRIAWPSAIASAALAAVLIGILVLFQIPVAKSATTPQPAEPAPKGHAAPADHVNLSAHAKIASDALALPPVRAERIEEMKKLIQSGQFDTDARLESALDGFLAENRDILEE